MMRVFQVDDALQRVVAAAELHPAVRNDNIDSIKVSANLEISIFFYHIISLMTLFL